MFRLSAAHNQQACVALCSMGEEYLQLSTLAPLRQHSVFYGRCAIDVLEVSAAPARSSSSSSSACCPPPHTDCAAALRAGAQEPTRRSYRHLVRVIRSGPCVHVRGVSGRGGGAGSRLRATGRCVAARQREGEGEGCSHAGAAVGGEGAAAGGREQVHVLAVQLRCCRWMSW